MKRNAANRLMAALFGTGDTNMLKMPRFKPGPKQYPHHNEQEMARRRDQTQHHNQVKIDKVTK